MGTDVGGNLRRAWAVRPGKLVRKPLVKAVSRVEREGEKSVACANATMSEVDCLPMWWLMCVGLVLGN